MAISVFKSFQSTVTRFLATALPSNLRLLVDPTTGAPVGIQSQNAGGPDGIWVPVDITSAQLLAPPAAMLADLNATYRLSIPPYSRYHSDGVELVAITPTAEFVVPAGINELLYAPINISPPMTMLIQGQVRIQNYPA